MPEEIRRLMCQHGRAGDEPCTNPAMWETMGPVHDLFCAEHMAERIEEGLGERWEQFGLERYLEQLDDALGLHHALADLNTPALKEVGMEVIHLLEEELKRARDAYRRATGEEWPETESERRRRLEMLEGMMGDEA